MRDLLVDSCLSLAREGARRFYALGVGAKGSPAVEAAARALAAKGVLLRGSDLYLGDARRRVTRATDEVHAGGAESSMVLAIDKSAADPSHAAFAMPPLPAVGTGSAGAPVEFTPASADRGEAILRFHHARLAREIEELRTAPLPPVTSATPAGQPRASAAPGSRGSGSSTGSGGDERDIRALAMLFTQAWHMKDAHEVAALWTPDGDMMHPDGTIERGQRTIAENRASIFARKRYQASEHPVTVYTVRFRGPDIAVVDGRWELRRLRDDSGRDAPTLVGQFTWVVQRGERWRVAAWRYTIGEPTRADMPR
jgi:uncharacterized protein (TIGR02246 family)